MKPTIQRRYKLYRQTLLGKVVADEYVDMFTKNQKGLDEYEERFKNRYSGSFVENDTWWIACISKVETTTVNPRWSDEIWSQNDVAWGTTLYMHKYRDMAVAKVSLISYGQWDSKTNAINNVFIRMLRTLGYQQTEFDPEEKTFYRYKTRIVKILIPPDKTEDDLAELLQAVDKYNDFVRLNDMDMTLWENIPRLAKAVKNLIRPEKNNEEAV